MQKKIKELAEQATDKWIGGEFFDREKFAELIVQDVKLAEQNTDKWIGGGKFFDREKFAELIVQDVLNTMYGEIQYQFSFDLAEEITRSVAKLYDTEFVKYTD